MFSKTSVFSSFNLNLICIKIIDQCFKLNINTLTNIIEVVILLLISFDVNILRVVLKFINISCFLKYD